LGNQSNDNRRNTVSWASSVSFLSPCADSGGSFKVCLGVKRYFGALLPLMRGDKGGKAFQRFGVC
jgi:hypothetical protein